VPLVGGRPCLDLVNSVSWRGAAGRPEDHLRSAEDCLVWCVRADVLISDEADRLRKAVGDGRLLVASLHRLRDLVGVHFADPGTPDLPALDGVVREAISHSRLVAAEGSARWQVDGLDQRTPGRRIALDLYDQLTRPRGRVGRCGDPACGWVFVDTSRAASRRWCSSADCGNRHRVRRHQERRRTRRTP